MIRILCLCTAVGLWPAYAIFVAPVVRMMNALIYVLDNEYAIRAEARWNT